MENKFIELAKSLDAKLTEGCSEGEILASINVSTDDVVTIIEYIVETERAKEPCTSAEEAKNTSFDHTIEMMRSSDYKERFRAEYEQTKIRYEKLKNFNTKIEAATWERGYKADGVTEPKHDCPYDLLREQQGVMGKYLHLLEVRAEIEHIEL